MVNITLKDLTYHKGKLILVIIGLISSVFLVQFSFGMYFGSIREYSRIASEYGHEAWVTAEDMDTLLAFGIINDTSYEEIRNIDGVKDIDRVVFLNGMIEGENSVKGIQIVGFDLESCIIPWDTVPGDYRDMLEGENTIIIDESIKNTFPDLKKGDKINIGNMVEYNIVGFTSGGILMGTPYAWTSLETARKLIPWAGNFSTCMGIKFEAGYSFEDFKEDTKNIAHISVYLPEEIENNTDDFIMNKMGVGMLLFLMAGLGFAVGLIIISTTVYQSVMEKIPQFGTLKAIGADKSLINKMMFGQVFILMTIGFILGTIMTMMMGETGGGAMQIAVDFNFSIMLYILMLGTSFLCAYISIRKVHKIDPAIVFRR